MSVLIKYGFQDMVASYNRRGLWWIKWLVPRRKREKYSHLSRWEKMRKVCEELGPTFIKFGQILSNRPDLIPAELAEELGKLREGVPPISTKKAREIVRDALGRPVSEVFDGFSEEPLASASIAQVHTAILRETGEKVALKIQRPSIRKVIEDDIKIMYDLARILSSQIPSIRPFDPEGLVKNFESSIAHELDFIHEATNMRRFAWNFRKQQNVAAPKVVSNYSTGRLLVMEYVQGIHLSDLEKIQEAGLDRRRIARSVAETFYQQVFRDGFFHADPHQGNFIIRGDHELVYIDYGMMGNLLPRDIEQLGTLMLALATQNVDMILQAIQKLTDTVRFEDRKALEMDLSELVNTYAFLPDFEQYIGRIMFDLTQVMTKHHMVVPSNFFLLIRAMFAVEGLTRTLDPDIVLYEIMRPRVLEMIGRQRNPARIASRLMNSLYDLGGYMQDIPMELRQTLTLLRRGDMKVDLNHHGVDPLVLTFNRIARQIVASVIIAALIVGSSLILSFDVGPKWGTTPLLSILGFSLSGILGAGLFVNLLKQKRFTDS